MAWIESHQELGRHPKTARAARRLGVSRVTVVGHLHYLWWWCLDYASDGDLSPYSAEEIAEAAAWDGDPAAFVSALVEAGFLDRTDGRLVVHDNADYNGKLKRQREDNRQRQQRFRDKQRDVTVTTPLPNRHVTPLHNTTEQNIKAAAAPNGAGAREAPPPPPPASPGSYETALAALLPAVADRWHGIHSELTEPWLRAELRRIEADVGPLPQADLISGLRLAQQQIERAAANGGIKQTPRGFAAKVMADAIREQRRRPPRPSQAS